MTRIHWLSFALLFALLTGISPALAQSTDPPAPPIREGQAIAKRCIEHMKADADRCIGNIQEITTETRQEVRTLLDAGQGRQAYVVAHAAVEQIERLAARCRGEIQGHQQSCVAKLRSLGEDELIEKVNGAARAQKGRVLAAEKRARAVLLAPFRRDRGDR